MDIKDLIKHSNNKAASKFKDVFSSLLQDRIYSKIDAKRPIIAKTMFTEVSGDKEAYQAFFNKKLEKFGVESQSGLSKEDKDKFFAEIETEWTGDNK